MAYLYGLVLIGPESSESIQLLNGALEKDPKFAWPHLSLAQIFSSRKFRDTGKANAHRRSFLDLCPTSFEGYKELSRADDKQETISIYAARLRALLQEREDIDSIAGYPTPWTPNLRRLPLPNTNGCVSERLVTCCVYARSIYDKSGNGMTRSKRDTG